MSLFNINLKDCELLTDTDNNKYDITEQEFIEYENAIKTQQEQQSIYS